MQIPKRLSLRLRWRPEAKPLVRYRRDTPPCGTDPPHARQPTIEECQRRRIILAAVAQPVEDRGCVDRGQDRPLGVPTEIRRTIPRRMPDRIEPSGSAVHAMAASRACIGSASTASPRRIASLYGRFCSSRSAITARTRSYDRATPDQARPHPPPFAGRPSRRTPRSGRPRRRETATRRLPAIRRYPPAPGATRLR